MEKNLNHYVALYQQQLKQGDILIAYKHLVKFVMKLRVDLMKSLSEQYTFTSILHGYMDYTYFYYTNDFLKAKKLKLGLVLNHLDMRFEIWLLGNTVKTQKMYWDLLKNSKWNENRTEMPKYSIIEAVIDEQPDFDDLTALTHKLEAQLVQTSDAITEALGKLND